MHCRALYDWLVQSCVGATFHFASALPPLRRPGGAVCALPSRTSLACDVVAAHLCGTCDCSRRRDHLCRQSGIRFRCRCVVGDPRTCLRKPTRTPRLRRFSDANWFPLPSSCQPAVRFAPVAPAFRPERRHITTMVHAPVSASLDVHVAMPPSLASTFTCWNSRVLAQNERALRYGFHAVVRSAHLSWVFPPSRD